MPTFTVYATRSASVQAHLQSATRLKSCCLTGAVRLVAVRPVRRVRRAGEAGDPTAGRGSRGRGRGDGRPGRIYQQPRRAASLQGHPLALSRHRPQVTASSRSSSHLGCVRHAFTCTWWPVAKTPQAPEKSLVPVALLGTVAIAIMQASGTGLWCIMD